MGSGFSFELDEADISNGFEYKDKVSKSAKSVIITNAHVIENCVAQGSVKVLIDQETTRNARIFKLDELNDLAMLTLDLEIPPLSGASWKPLPGYWTMALGSPHNFAGSVTFGNIINLDSSSVFHTASLSPGNSGGPLVDNEGYLYGVNTGSKPVGQNFNISIGVNAFCDQLIKCPTSRYWKDK
jgi:S1-C subfamily serine protease